MKIYKLFFLSVFLILTILSGCSDDNTTEPTNNDPEIILPDISVSVDAYPKFSVASSNIRFFISSLSDESEREHFNLKFDHNGDGIFEEGTVDSVFWLYKIAEMGKYNVDVLIEYDNTAFDTTQIQIYLTSTPTACYASDGPMAVDFTWSSDSRKIVFSDMAHNPNLVDIINLTVENPFVGDDQTCRHHGALSPDGRYIAYDSGLNIDGISYLDLTTGIEQILTADESIQCISWSPDGSKLAVTTLHDSLFIVSFPGGVKTFYEEQANSVCWSSDGSRLMLAHANSQNEKIKIFDMNSEAVTVIAEASFYQNYVVFPGRLTWVNNGDWIYSNLFRCFYNTATGEQKQFNVPENLGANAKELEKPVYDTALSPDGKYMALTVIPVGKEQRILHFTEIPEEIYE